jgi:DNA repair exonuclease SbcCD nuclease subunit
VKILRVGDPHVQVSNLKDSEALLDFVMSTAVDENVDRIEFLGDMFHTHAVVRVEVVDFWRRKLWELCSETGIEVFLLCGNHDQPGSKEKEQEMNALQTLDGCHKLVKIIDKPYICSKSNIGYVPYHSNEEHFLSEAAVLYNQGASECLIAHQTFTGAQYENGFFSEEGIDPAKLLQKAIISGHIHKSQQVGKCFYPGTPKWDTMADANQPKGIWIFQHSNFGGAIEAKVFISTENIVTPITSYEVKEGEELPALNPDARNYVVLEGKTAWINKVKKELKGKANVKVKPTDVRVAKDIKDASMTLEKYLEKEFQPIEGVKKESIKEFLREV